MNHHHLYSQPNVPSEHYGNMMNCPYSLPTQSDTYDMPTSAFQQHGGGNNNAYHLHPLGAPLPLHRNSYPCQPTVAAGTSTRSSAYGSTNGSAYDSAYGFGMLSDNTAKLRFEYADDYHTRFRNRLASLQHQVEKKSPSHLSYVCEHLKFWFGSSFLGYIRNLNWYFFVVVLSQNGTSSMWTPQGLNDSVSTYYSLYAGPQNQQSLSFRHNQQEELYRGIGNAFQRTSRYNASLDQQNSRRGDPSNQTQQQQWPKNN